MKKHSDNLELAVTMDVGKEVLLISYYVKNHNTAPLFLFNILHDFPGDDGIYEIDQGAYVEMADGEVVISKKQLSLPPGVLVEKEIVPFVTRISPGRSFKETFKLALPLSHRVYYEDSESESVLSEKRSKNVKARFEIGYFYGMPGTDELAETVPTDRGDVLGFDPFPITSQRIISVGPFPAVPVLLPR